jgi:N4-gp56 family major capsid protein
MAGSNTTSLANLIPQIIAEATFVASERSIMRGLVKNYTVPLGSGNSIKVPIYPIVSASAYTSSADTEITNSTVTADSAVLTLGTVAIRTMVSDMARSSAASNIVADMGRLFGEAIARKIDTDLTALFSSFSTVIGNATTTISPAAIFQAVATLRAAGVPASDLYCVLHPSIAYDLKAALTTTGNTPFGAGAFGPNANEAMREGFVGMLSGVPVYETSNLANTGTTGDYKCGLFHRDALGLAMMGDISIETQRRASFLGDDIVASCNYAVGELYDGYGIQLFNDSSIL